MHIFQLWCLQLTLSLSLYVVHLWSALLLHSSLWRNNLHRIHVRVAVIAVIGYMLKEPFSRLTSSVGKGHKSSYRHMAIQGLKYASWRFHQIPLRWPKSRNLISQNAIRKLSFSDLSFLNGHQFLPRDSILSIGWWTMRWHFCSVLKTKVTPFECCNFEIC